MATIDDKIQRIIARLEANTSLKNMVPASTMYSLVEASAMENMKVESTQELLDMQRSISRAVGSDLDNIGSSIFGVSRRDSIAPTVTAGMKLIKFYVMSGTFGSINNGQDISVQGGTIVEGATTSGYLKFAISPAITLPASASEFYVDADLISGPYDIIPANSLIKHDCTTYAGLANSSLLVTNPNVIATGMPQESDDNYRYRISTALQSFVKSNYFGIHDLVTGIPGVSDISIFSADNGGGTFTVYVKSISPVMSSQLLSDVQTAIYQNVPPWVNFIVTGPSYVGLKINITVTTSNLSQIGSQDIFKQQIINAISSYVNNIQTSSFDVQDIQGVVIASNPNITNAVLSAVTVYKGETFRASMSIDLTDSVSRYITIAANEEVVIEPIASAITVSL